MPAPLPDTVDGLVREALNDRPELKGLRLEESSDQRLIKAEHSSFFPTIGIAGSAGFVPAGYDTVPGRYGAIGMTVSIPILNGGLYRARQTEAELKAKAAEENVNDTANRVVRDVRVAFLNATTARDRMALTKQLLGQAKLALDLAQTRYDLGLGSIVELGTAQLNVTSAEIEDVSAQYEYQQQRAILEYQIGALK